MFHGFDKTKQGGYYVSLLITFSVSNNFGATRLKPNHYNQDKIMQISDIDVLKDIFLIFKSFNHIQFYYLLRI